MSGSGSFAVTRKHGGDRFYSPPAIRRHQQQLLLQKQQQEQHLQQQLQIQQNQPRQQQQQQVQRPVGSESEEAEVGPDSDTLSNPSVCSASPPRSTVLTNIDRLVDSVTPTVPAKYFSEARIRGLRAPEIHPYFSLCDLWESFKEWSMYGAGVPLILAERESVKQYYVPSLSGIQLYMDPMRVRRPGQDSDAEPSIETTSGDSSDYEMKRRNKSMMADGACNQHNLMDSNSQRINRLSLRDKPHMSSSSDESEVSNSPGHLIFEYLEKEQPYHRKPLSDKISILASQFPDLNMYNSCDLLPSSWICVAWYPIYRIPVGTTLQNLDASFLTFHSLSTHSRSKNHPHFPSSSGQKKIIHGTDHSSSKITLPVFGLASYKLKGSILTQGGDHERQQANSLLQSADTWLRSLQVNLSDFQFFASHNSQWR